MEKTTDTRVLGLIPARFGSRRFPGKPLALIGEKTLIQRTYENAKKCTRINDIAVLTDDARIFDHVKSFGGEAVMTSTNCPTGTERLAEAIKSAESFTNDQIIINIQGDEPFLEPEVIEKVIDILEKDKEAAMSTAVVKIESEKEANDFSVVKCVKDFNDNALYFSRSLIPHGHSGKWQKDLTYYKHLGIYGYRRDFLLHYAELKPTPLQLAEDLEQLKVLENGYKIKVAVVESDSHGIDTPEDLKKIKRPQL